ncbi:MAG: hypothetical protein EOO38_10155 [Cytophagaceae bacterium]|nr:MAG: hypothetical protein EOO38_10155 [Cytophagaceae bacterium]
MRLAPFNQDLQHLFAALLRRQLLCAIERHYHNPATYFLVLRLGKSIELHYHTSARDVVMEPAGCGRRPRENRARKLGGILFRICGSRTRAIKTFMPQENGKVDVLIG